MYILGENGHSGAVVLPHVVLGKSSGPATVLEGMSLRATVRELIKSLSLVLTTNVQVSSMQSLIALQVKGQHQINELLKTNL